jgi:hypothetical protein
VSISIFLDSITIPEVVFRQNKTYKSYSDNHGAEIPSLVLQQLPSVKKAGKEEEGYAEDSDDE